MYVGFLLDFYKYSDKVLYTKMYKTKGFLKQLLNTTFRSRSLVIICPCTFKTCVHFGDKWILVTEYAYEKELYDYE